jgi:hypothetical protein
MEASGLLKKFESIKAHSKEVYENFEELETRRFTAISSALPVSHILSAIDNQEKRKIRETQMILEEYHNSFAGVKSITKITLPYLSIPSSVEQATGVLHRISIECENVIGFLNAAITPLSPEDVDKLNKLRSELAEVTTKLDINYEKNLTEAINEQEKGHSLASALITARVLNYIIDQIEGKTVEDKIKFLQDKNIIEKGEEVKAFVIKASKKARNVFSHDIKIFANPSDSLSMLGDCVKLLGILTKLLV